METQKQGIIDQVLESKSQGRKTKEILKTLGVKPSSYYRWLSAKKRSGSESYASVGSRDVDVINA